jgi:hypothetical protein
MKTLDLTTLDQVTGGNSTAQVQVGVQGAVRGTPFNAGLNAQTSTTDYARCVDTVARMPNATPSDIAATCGMPPAPAGGAQQ